MVAEHATKWCSSSCYVYIDYVAQYLVLSGISHVAVGGFLPLLNTAVQVRRRLLLETQPPPAEALPEG